MAMLQHKIHLLATPATETAISCGVSANQVMCGTVCLDLGFVKEHHTVIGALCIVTHIHKSLKGCIVYRPHGKPKYTRRQFEELCYAAGPLKTEKEGVYQIFNLPQVWISASTAHTPGIKFPKLDQIAESDIGFNTEDYTQSPQLPSIDDDDSQYADQDDHFNLVDDGDDFRARSDQPSSQDADQNDHLNLLDDGDDFRARLDQPSSQHADHHLNLLHEDVTNNHQSQTRNAPRREQRVRRPPKRYEGFIPY